MPKKFVGENSKSSAARAKKAASKAEEDEKRQKQAADEYWKDDAKHVVKKQNRKEEADRKKVEQQQKKLEAAALLHQEEAKLEKEVTPRRPAAKVTRVQVQAEAERRSVTSRPAPVQKAPEKAKLEAPVALEENINRLSMDSDQAHTVEEAIAVLSVGGGDDADRHPERRMKAAFKAYEEEEMPRIKKENPGMRLSQLKHMLSKEWSKAPQNPHNQKHIAYNAKPSS